MLCRFLADSLMKLNWVRLKLVAVNHCLDISSLRFGVKLSWIGVRVYLAIHDCVLCRYFYSLFGFLNEALCHHFLRVYLVLDGYLLAALIALAQLIEYDLRTICIDFL